MPAPIPTPPEEFCCISGEDDHLDFLDSKIGIPIDVSKFLVNSQLTKPGEPFSTTLPGQDFTSPSRSALAAAHEVKPSQMSPSSEMRGICWQEFGRGHQP